MSVRISNILRRMLQMLLEGGQTASALQIGAGTTHSPSGIQSLRAKGLEIPCSMITVRNRDGDEVRTGLYTLTNSDREKARALLAK
jgi:hypothetical protein